MSSTAIRAALARGRRRRPRPRCSAARSSSTAIVVAGDQRGGTLGYPDGEPRGSSPISRARGTGSTPASALGHRAAISIGTNPHYGGTERRIEPYLLDFDGDLYGKRLVVELWERLRDEAVFESEEALVAQIAARRRGDEAARRSGREQRDELAYDRR